MSGEWGARTGVGYVEVLNHVNKGESWIWKEIYLEIGAVIEHVFDTTQLWILT